MVKVLVPLLAALLLSGCKVQEENTSPITPQAEYTEDNPGEWEDLEDAHVPVVEIEYLGRGKKNIRIKVRDSSTFNASHYIEKIGIFDQNKVDIVVKPAQGPGMFTTEFYTEDLPEHPGVKAFVKCNLHDLWTTPLFPEKRKPINF